MTGESPEKTQSIFVEEGILRSRCNRSENAVVITKEIDVPDYMRCIFDILQ